MPAAVVVGLLGAALAAALMTLLVFGLIRRAGRPMTGIGPFERTFDLTINYLSHYLLAALLLSPLLGLTTGNPVAILVLPVLHFFAAIPILPGAFVICYVGDRRLKRTWSRTRAWVAAVLTVIGMWLLSFGMILGKPGPPELLVALGGEKLAIIAEVASVPMSAAAVSLTLAWLLPSRVRAIQ